MNVYKEIQRNRRRTVIIITLFILLIGIMGYALTYLYGPSREPINALPGVIFALILASVFSLGSYFGGDKMALWTSGAQQINQEDNPYVWRMVENVAITAGIPMPRVHIIPDHAMNAFATGRNPQTASIALTQGLIERLENEELEAVIAHELSHIQNLDVRVMMIVAVLVGAIALLADFAWRFSFYGPRRRNNRESSSGGGIEIIIILVGVLLLVIAPLIAELMRLAISRRREYLADASAVLLTRYADGLIKALEKIGASHEPLKRANAATAHLYFTNPFGAKGMFSKLFSTHPPIEDRIRALRSMAG